MFVGDLNIVVGIQDSVAKELEIVRELETTFVKTVQVTDYVTTSRTLPTFKKKTIWAV